MLTSITPRARLALILILALSMLLTRPHTIASLHHLPGTSWAVFFIAGALLRGAAPLVGFCVLSALIDWAAIRLAGVSDACVTPAYALMFVAFGALWLGGRGYARLHRDRLASLPWLAGAVLVSAFLAELLSSGGYYAFSGRFAEPNLAEFLPRLARYFPGMLGAMALYVGVAALVYTAWVISASGSARRGAR